MGAFTGMPQTLLRIIYVILWLFHNGYIVKQMCARDGAVGDRWKGDLRIAFFLARSGCMVTMEHTYYKYLGQHYHNV